MELMETFRVTQIILTDLLFAITDLESMIHLRRN